MSHPSMKVEVERHAVLKQQGAVLLCGGGLYAEVACRHGRIAFDVDAHRTVEVRLGVHLS